MSNNITSITSGSDVVVLGAGLAGLTAAHKLTEASYKVITIEKNKKIGGLAATIEQGGFRFDLGGHRFLTNDKTVDNYVKNLLAGDYLTVPRSSKIFLNKKYFDYPLQPRNSLLGLGIFKSLKIISDYLFQKLKNKFVRHEQRSLKDWVTAQFGKTMFKLYFRDYSEKVWGMDCNMIASEWISQRIQGLSLGDAIKAAVLNRRDKKHTTLTDNFIYPHLGIGSIAESQGKLIAKHNEILTSSVLVRLNHTNGNIINAVIKQGDRCKIITANEFISSIPLTKIVEALSPNAPQFVIDATKKLKFRDLITVTLMIKKEKVTDQTWIYFPDKDIPFGRIHEPANWSARMAPPGNTSLVAEYFCFRNDEVWTQTDKQLSDQTIAGLQKLHIVDKRDVIDSVVIRIPDAYPIFEVGFQEQCEIIYKYLEDFENLSLTGRGGTYQYFNMDHTIGSGMEIVNKILGKYPSRTSVGNDLCHSNKAGVTCL